MSWSLYFDVNIIKYLEYPRYYYDIAAIWPQSTFLVSYCQCALPPLLIILPGFPSCCFQKNPDFSCPHVILSPEMISATSTYLSFEIKIFYFKIFRQPSFSSLLAQLNVLSVHSRFPMAALLFLLRLIVTPERLSHSIRAASLHHSEAACKHDLLVLLWWPPPILSWFIILYFTNKEHREKSCPFIHWIHRLPLAASHWIFLKYILAQSSL